MAERKTQIQAESILSVTRKYELMDVGRSTLYYKPINLLPNLEELPACNRRTGREIKKEMDKLHTKYPFMGSRSLRDQLRSKGYKINRNSLDSTVTYSKAYDRNEYSFNSTEAEYV